MSTSWSKLSNINEQIWPHEQIEFRPHDQKFDLKKLNFDLMKFDLLSLGESKGWGNVLKLQEKLKINPKRSQTFSSRWSFSKEVPGLRFNYWYENPKNTHLKLLETKNISSINGKTPKLRNFNLELLTKPWSDQRNKTVWRLPT